MAVLTATAGLVASPAVTADAAVPKVRAGMEINVEETLITASSCTLGAVVSQRKALTAGHCGKVGQVVYDRAGVPIGKITANESARKLDIAVITLAPRVSTKPDVVDFDAVLQAGQPISKYGITTGRGTGQIVDPRPELITSHGFSLAPHFFLEQATHSVKTTLRSQGGDSGAGVRDADGRVVGILSSGDDKYTFFAPVSRLPQRLR
ncbi:trypsin-like serine protease [Gordonia aurantiaca]|uniref:trypsin-like serine protease n=1 Tax=Gordonia sp. B21 TaxID=3151852 RepID=UPI003267B190